MKENNINVNFDYIEERKLKAQTLENEMEEGWWKECHEIYEDILRYAEGKLEDVEMAELRRDYARFLLDCWDLDRGIELMETNVKMFRKLAEQSPETYKSELARDISMLAAFHSRYLKHFESVEREYAEAIGIYQELAERYPDAYMSQLAHELDSLANFYSFCRKNEQAEQEFGKAVIIYRKLFEESPGEYMRELANVLIPLSHIHEKTGKIQEAEQEYVELISIVRKLAEDNPDKYMPKVARYLKELVGLHIFYDLHRYEQAEQECNEALSIYRKLAATSPELYNSDIAWCLGLSSCIYYEQGKPELTLTALEEAICADPKEYHYLDLKCEILLEMGRNDDALEVYHQILEKDADYLKKTNSDLEKVLKEKGII